jgi:transposase-like protein
MHPPLANADALDVEQPRQIDDSERVRAAKVRRRIALEDLRVVHVPRVRCPFCDSTAVQRNRTTRTGDGDGAFRHTVCKICDERFIVSIE